MSWQMASLLLLGGSTILLFVGIPVAFSFIAINLIGAVLFLGGDAGLNQLVRNGSAAVLNFSLTPIPLFVLMGEVLFHTGLAIKVIAAIERLIRQVPGRLAVVAVVAGTVFSAISGSTIATTAMLGSLMLPVMLARGYHPTMATGPLMAIGAVDMLIPPSALTVLLGSLSGISISKLLIVGAMTFSQILSFSGASNGMVEVIATLGLPPMAVIAVMMLVLIFLGLFVEQVSMMMITLPIFMPLVQKFGVDPVWFGVMFLICMQLGLLLPPHGLLLMTMKGVSPPQVTMGHIFRAVVPYLFMSLLVLALVFFVPAVAVWLPKALF